MDEIVGESSIILAEVPSFARPLIVDLRVGVRVPERLVRGMAHLVGVRNEGVHHLLEVRKLDHRRSLDELEHLRDPGGPGVLPVALFLEEVLDVRPH